MQFCAHRVSFFGGTIPTGHFLRTDNILTYYITKKACNKLTFEEKFGKIKKKIFWFAIKSVDPKLSKKYIFYFLLNLV